MTIKEFYKVHDREISVKIFESLREDCINCDVTSKLILNKAASPGKKITAKLLCYENCVLAGLNIFKRTFQLVDKKISFTQFFKDGDKIPAGSVVLKISGSPYNILRAERTALNFIQRMSGIATLTSKFVRQLKYKNSKILHTRKTTPNFRLFEVAAVKLGGGDFHRLNLSSSVLIKDNHIKAAGSIKRILKKLRGKKLNTKLEHKLETEVKSMTELKDVLKYGKGIVKVVMLDNFSPSNVKIASILLKRKGFRVELSGGINDRNFKKIQNENIDFYSIGMLTHSYKSVNFSLEF